VNDALAQVGFGACGARHISGTMSLHTELERRIARFVGQERALFFTTGYGANLAVLQALGSQSTLVLSDELNHASLIDGCRLSRARAHVYRHTDLDHVEELLRRHRHEAESAIVVTESLYSMDGDYAPLRELRELCDEFNAALVVDEAHAFGAIGPRGRGLCALLGVVPDVLMGSFGKALGASGAFLVAKASVLQLIENRARSYVFSTAPSPTVAAAALAALELVEHAGDRRTHLREHTLRLRAGLSDLGYHVLPGDSHIIPVLLGSPGLASEFSRKLLALGIFVHGIRPPTVPPGTSRLRIAAMATHTPDQIEFALEKFRELAR
jgi:8-amino-7-oxononanoate synthase